MNPANITLVLSFCAPLAVAGPNSTLDRESSSSPRTPDYCVLSDIVGAKVTMHPGAKAVAEATKDAEVAKRPTGKIEDILIDTCTGETEWAIVEFDEVLGLGGKTVVVPCDLLSWNKSKECFDLAQSDDQLKALPSFDADDARKNGIDGSLVAFTAHWPDAVFDHRHELSDQKNPDLTRREDVSPGSDDVKKACPTFMIDERPCTCATPQFVFASDVSEAKVHARDGEFGKVTTNLIDRSNRRVALLAVTHGDTLGVGGYDILVPFDRLCLHENEKGRAYCTGHTVKALEAGVRYEKPDNGVLDPADASRAKAFFAGLDDSRDDR